MMLPVLSSLLLAGLVCGQIKVLAPADLAQRFRKGDLMSPNGVIIGTTATFGAPSYGESFIGRVIFFESDLGSYCQDNSEYQEKAQAAIAASTADTSDGVKNVFLLSRGGCTFVRKVEIAEKNKADAVIIVDEEGSDWDRSKLNRVIMADDGHGVHVNIPSVLVTKEDGAALIKKSQELAKEGKQQLPILVEFEWSLPQASTVAVDFWTSYSTRQGINFLREFAPLAERLGELLDFRLHFYIVELPETTSVDLVQEQCYKGDPRFCAPATEGSALQGRMVVEEDLRQLCLIDQPAGLTLWWKYLEHFAVQCMEEASKGQISSNSLGDCSNKILLELGGESVVSKMKACVSDKIEAQNYLMREKTSSAWSSLALRINGARYNGNLEPTLVLRAICSSFIQEPQICRELIRESSRIGGRPQVIETTGWSPSEVFLLFCMLVVIVACGLYLYQRHMSKAMRASLRHEVMMEVRNQMMEYKELGDDFLRRP